MLNVSVPFQYSGAQCPPRPTTNTLKANCRKDDDPDVIRLDQASSGMSWHLGEA